MTAITTGRPRRTFSIWNNSAIEAIAVGIWFLATARRFDHDTEVLYLLCCYFVVGAVLHRQAILPLVQRAWPILLLPPWILLSPLWSAVPAMTFKYALQLVLTLLVCFYVVARVPVRSFITALFVTLTFYEIISIPHIGQDAEFSGVFGQKNFLAYRMSILACLSLTVFLDSKFHTYLRWAAAPIGLIAIGMIILSHSATSMVVSLLCAGIIGGVAWVWGPARGYRVLIVALGVAAVTGAALIVFQDPTFNLQDKVLGALGKDSTLTGRQELWDYAGKLISQKPLLGLGPGSFWLPERLDAQELLESHFKERNSVFLFHNSYIEITVYLGYTGLVLGLIGWIWSFAVNVSRVTTKATVIHAFFAAICVLALVRTYVESDLWQPFEYAQMIIWIGALYDLAPKRAPSFVRRAQVPTRS